MSLEFSKGFHYFNELTTCSAMSMHTKGGLFKSL